MLQAIKLSLIGAVDLLKSDINQWVYDHFGIVVFSGWYHAPTTAVADSHSCITYRLCLGEDGLYYEAVDERLNLDSLQGWDFV